MFDLSLTQIAHNSGGVLVNPGGSFSHLTTDSRSASPGGAFVALRGDRYDGHDFVVQAVEQGAEHVVVDSLQTQLGANVTQWVVADTRVALAQIAEANRDKFTGPLVALTGSNGKTTVKEMLANIIGSKADTLFTQGNLNNEIGVPLTLLRLCESNRYAVIEMGANSLGEIARMSEIAKPDVAVINNIGDAHLGGFGSVDNILRAKSEIFNGLGRANTEVAATGVINLDSYGADVISDQLSESSYCSRLIRFSLLDERADVVARDIQLQPDQSEFVLVYQNQPWHIRLPLPGRHAVANAVCAASCAIALDFSIEDIAAALAQFEGVAGRTQRQFLANGACLIDDTYNASPSSMRAAIDLLGLYEGQRILVLGDMAELGEESQRLHDDIVRYAKQAGIEMLFTLGERMTVAANNSGINKIQGFAKQDDHNRLADALLPNLNTATTVLIKGSRSARMDRVAQYLIDKTGGA